MMYGIITYKQQLVQHFVQNTPRSVPLLTHTFVVCTYFAVQIKTNLYDYEQINICVASIPFVSYVFGHLAVFFLFKFERLDTQTNATTVLLIVIIAKWQNCIQPEE